MIRKRIQRLARSFRRKSSVNLLGHFYSGLSVLVFFGFGWGIYFTAIYAHNTELLEVHGISISDLYRISENEILRRAGYMPGMNVFSVDLDEIRRAVEEVVWVRHATVQRVWPDEIVISVVEREPIALARIDGEIYEVDIEGVVLSPDAPSNTSAPILDGLHVDDREGNETKIRIYRKTIETIGERELSEVHVAESGDVSVVSINDPILIDLGASEHRDRWERYVRLRTRIHEDYPHAFRVDLRFRDQVIIQTKENEPAGNAIWDEEIKLL